MSPRDRWASADVIGDDAAASRYQQLEVVAGLELTHRPSRVKGEVIAFTANQRVVLRDEDGNRHEFKPHAGALLYKGKPVELVGDWKPDTALKQTASGSIAMGATPSRIARASRIWVEGIHDAELIERIWGDDLRIEGIVVEPLHGADDLIGAIRSFAPGKGRRLGVLLDHLVPGSKESRLAATVAGPSVLICGHPYVDIWQAVRPVAVGIAEWPAVPLGTPWKDGVIAALGRQDDPASLWRDVLGKVGSYKDIETPLVNSVEKLIDFVSAGEGSSL